MNKKISKGWKKISKAKKAIKKHVMNLTTSETVVGSTIVSGSAIGGIVIGVGGAPVIIPVLASVGITVGTVVSIVYMVEKINELEQNNTIKNNGKPQTKNLISTI